MTGRPARAASGYRRESPGTRRRRVSSPSAGFLALVAVLGAIGFVHARTTEAVRHVSAGERAWVTQVALSDPEIPTEKPTVPKPPSPGGGPGNSLPTNLPAPGSQKVDKGVSGPFETILGWIAWGVFALCVAGILLVAGQMAIRHKNGQAGAHINGLAWVAVACIVAASASAIIGGVLG
jgi:hypothetical protein